MRRVSTEMDVQGQGGRSRHRRNIEASLQSRRRRITLEGLERRELMAVIPTPIVTDQTGVANAGTTTVNFSAPSITINPNDSNQLVSVYTSIDTSQSAGFQIRVNGRYSLNGGVTWNALAVPANLTDPTTLSGTPAPFTTADEAYVAFDRNNNVYVGVLQQNNSNNAGSIVVTKYSMALGAPVQVSTVQAYQWNQSVTGQERQPAVINFHLAVDDNLGTFTDANGTLVDANAGNVYIAMGADTPPPPTPPAGYARNSIRLIHSTDGGATFSAGIAVDGFNNSSGTPQELVTRPRIAISQGTTNGTIEAGRVTVIWDDTGSGRTASPYPLDLIQSRSVRATGATLATVGGRVQVASTRVLGSLTGVYGRTTLPTAKGVGPTPELASDNSLGTGLGVVGVNSGRLYVAYTDWDGTWTTNPAENTDIRLAVSNNGGASWTVLSSKVNDDSAFTDGKTGAATSDDIANGLAPAGRPSGRTQFMPSIAVDRANGTVFLSFYDARDDASNARVATYLAASIDGGSSFAPQTFANDPFQAIDAITGQLVTLGPIPDNQSANSKVEGTFGFGDHQSLAVANGVAHPIWTGNLNGGHEGENNLSIRTARASFTAGGRVISATSGPIQSTTVFGTTFNNLKAADGRPLLDGFVVEFDRPIQTGTFGIADITVTYRDVLTPASGAGINVTVAGITPIVNPAGRFLYFVSLDSASINAIYATQAGGVGTYTYAIGPDILDFSGNQLDQNGNGIPGEVTDVFTVPTVDASGKIDTTTLPLIVPGPQVVSTQIPGVAPTADNLVTDDKVRAIDVTFDRDMRPDSFTPEDILSILGPAGRVLVPQTVAAVGTNISRVIPNNPSTPLVSTISIPSNGSSFPIRKLTLKLNINHMQDSDLLIELISPFGTTITLADGVGGIGQNFVDTIFDDASNVNISAGTAPFTGTFAPMNAATPGQGLAAFIGQQLEGVWRLQITDKNGNASTGVLNSWSLTADPAATVTADPLGIGDQRTFRVGFPEQFLRGTYSLTLGSDIRSVTGWTGTGPNDVGAQLDTNKNAGLDLLFDRNPAGIDALPQTFSNSTAQGIPNTPTNPLVSMINVPTPSTPFFIGDLNVQLSITHTRDSDLKIELIGPDGTTITLADGVGGTGQNFTNTIFDDQATTLINLGTAPFAGPHRPSQALSAFNGRQLTGQWRLRVTDKVTNAFTGTLNNWSLTANTGPSVSYTAPVVPVVIPAGSVLAPTTTYAVLSIPDSFTIQSLTLNLGITYPNDPDLKGDLLVFPAGVDVNNPASTPVYSINLFNRDGNVGADGTRRNFTNTVFDDAATTPIQNGGPPFNGRFNPRQPLSILIGQNASAYQYVLSVTNYAGTTGSIDKFGLTLSKSVATTGLGEPVADRASMDFRIFTMDPTDPQSSNEWTPVGPASYSSGKLAGRMSSIEVDPSDPSGNTVFVGAASGGVWKTTNFLTNDPEGPTYLPLTDFGPTSSLNTGDMALFGRNGDPSQTVVLVGTGESATQYGSLIGGLNTSPGVGFILSYDGGVSWTLLDSVSNADAQGNLLPISQRNHDFVGMTINKVLIDPRYSVTGQIVMYAAITDPGSRGKVSPGIWRSIDSGRTWQLKRAGNATDIIFDENSGTIDAVSNPAGNLRTLFAAFGTGGATPAGVYITPNQGDTFNLLGGNVVQQSIRDDITDTPIPILNNAVVPTGQKIILVKPFLTGNVNQDAQYQTWVYAAGAGADGRFSGLWLTKDLGQSWTKVDLSNAAAPFNNNFAVPSNSLSLGDYDVTASAIYNLGLYNLSLGIDPNNPNIVYLGGTILGGHTSGMIRVDTTQLADAHSFMAPNDRQDGGLRQAYVTDGVQITRRNPSGPGPTLVSVGTADQNAHLNLVRDPAQPFLANSTIYVNNISNFSNSGSGATWTPFDAMLDGSGGVHQIFTYKDPLTGRARLILADDQGIFTGVDDNGTTLTGTGTVVLPTGSRNGNLQTTQFYYGASQPSDIGAQAAQALFYGMAQDNGFPASDPNVITPGSAGYGNLQWNGGYIGYGTNVATDQTGSGTVYRYKWPAQINDPLSVWSPSDFFKVSPDGGSEVSRTFNLFTGGGVGQWPGLDGTGAPLTGNFTVNPLTKNQMVMGSSLGWLYGTENQGGIWNIIANPSDLDGTYVKAPVYGAPDPNGPGVPGALNNYVLAGTQGGRIFVSLTGGGSGSNSNAWFNISSGLVNNDPIMAIITNPTRGSHEAYAISSSRVYRIADTSLKDANGVVVGSGWVDITGDLFQQTHTPFGDASLTETLIRAGSLTSIVADWRYVIPDTTPTPANPNPPTHPLLYVSGQGGVLRSINGVNGTANWTVFPDLSLNTPQEGGGMPTVQVTDLDMALGNINPTNGRPDVSTGPNVLLATTYGRGSYAIKLAPLVFESTVHLSPDIPAPAGSDSGRPTLTLPGSPDHSGDLTDLYTNVLTPIFQGLSQQSAFGGLVAITLYDATDPLNPVVIGGYDPASGPFDPLATYFTDAFGKFSVQVNDGVFLADHSTDGVHVIRVQATDQSGTRGNQATFTFTLDTTAPGDPIAPIAPTLNTGSDSGRFNDDNYTNITSPVLNMTPTEGNITVYLLRKAASDPASAYQIVKSMDLPPLLNGASPVPITIQDPGPLADGQYTYAVQEIDPAGNLGLISADSPVITIDTVRPLAPSKPVLDPASDSGVQGDNITNITNPIFSINTAEADPTWVFLKRNGSPVAGTGNPSNPRLGPGAIQDPGPLADATYSYTANQVDLAGNIGTDSAAQAVRILTIGPDPAHPPTVALLPDDDTGDKGDNRTNVRQPRLFGTVPIPPLEGYTLELVQVFPLAGAGVLATTPVPNTGNYQIQFPSPLPDGAITIIIRVRDVAGNTTSSPPLTLIINTAPPGITPTLTIDPTDDTGIQGDNKTTARRPHLVGNTSPGAIVEIIDSFGQTQATTTALLVPDGLGHAAGYFSAQLPFELNNGTITLTARARDTDGNVNPNVGTLTMTIYTVSGDFDNDGKADIGVYRPSTADWYINYSASTQGTTSHGWAQHDIPIPADYDGNGRVDITVFRPETATWYINRGANLGQYNVQWGWAGHDTPVPADYDGDGKTDIAIYRPETAQWYILGSSATVPVTTFGWQEHDKPVPGDYDGNGRDQIAVWRPETGQWFIRNISTGDTRIVPLGQMGDIPVPGDYDGIGRTEEAVYRPGTGQFFIYNPTDQSTRIVDVGAPNTDVPVSKDFDGDGKVDAAVYRPATADWRIFQSSTNQIVVVNYGWPLNDVAVHGTLAYRVAGVNNTSAGVPASSSASSEGSYVAQAATSSLILPPPVEDSNASLSLLKTSAAPQSQAAAPTVVIGASIPSPFQGRKTKKPHVAAVKLTDGHQAHKVAHPAKKAASRHPLNRFDSLLDQLSNEHLGKKAKHKG